MDDAEIVTNYCIGAEKKRSYGNGHEQCPHRRSDGHPSRFALHDIGPSGQDSRCRTLAYTPEWRELTDYSAAEHPAEGEAFLFIGDKVFGYEANSATHTTWQTAGGN